jgi:hypothetical protein
VIRSLTTSALASALALSAAAQAAELTFSGAVDAGYKADLTTLENAPISQYNLEANFTVDAKLSDKVSVQLYATSLAGSVPAAFSDGVDEPTGTYIGRWPGLAFDGAAITWKLDDAQTVTIGDLVYAKGSVGYYAAKRYSSVMRVAALRGASYANGGFLGFFGANDASDTLFTAGASYLFAIDSLNSIEPTATIHVGDAEDLPWSAGLQYKGKFGPAAVSASGSVYGGNDAAGESQLGYVLLAEPSIATDAFYVSSAFLFAPKAKDGLGDLFAYPMRHGRSYAAWGDDLTLYVEPGVNFGGGAAAAGLAVEYHEANLDKDKDEVIYFVPNLYLYPVKDMTITLWAEADMYTDSDKDMTYAAGLETVFKF